MLDRVRLRYACLARVLQRMLRVPLRCLNMAESGRVGHRGRVLNRATWSRHRGLLQLIADMELLQRVLCGEERQC